MSELNMNKVAMDARVYKAVREVGEYPLNSTEFYQAFVTAIVNEILEVVTVAYHETPLESCGYILGLNEKIATHFYGEQS